MVFRPKGEAFAAGCIQLYKDSHDLCCCCYYYYYYYYGENIRWISLAECLACMGRRKMHKSLRREHLRKGDHLKIGMCFKDTVGDVVDWLHSDLG